MAVDPYDIWVNVGAKMTKWKNNKNIIDNNIIELNLTVLHVEEN